MAILDSNIDDVSARIRRVVDTFDFNVPGVDGSLGRDLARTAANGIQGRSAVDQKAPDGSAYPENEPVYRERKMKRYGSDRANVRTGQMLGLDSLLGGTVISGDLVEMKYGTGQAPSSSATGAALSKQDESITDIEKAFFCSKTRPFYALDDTIADEMQKVAQDALDKHAGEAN